MHFLRSIHLISFVLFALFVDVSRSSKVECTEAAVEPKPERFYLFQLKWHEVATPLLVVCWILLASYGKIVFNLSEFVSEHFPDSALLILLGVVVGVILYFAGVDHHRYELPSNIFFLFLLPPIVFDAGYFMPNKSFFENLGTILIYAVIGTMWNTATIGASLYLLNMLNIFHISYTLLPLLLFASLISAVDPVAVLCVFEEVQVNEVLYIVVFGESLLNDAVTVVLYNIFNTFTQIGASNIIPIDIVTGVVSFFTVALGGVLIGVLWALVVSFTTRWTGHVKILNPLFVFLIPYVAYLTAELFGLSSIMAIVFCGIFMKQYIKENIGDNARVATKYMVKMASSSAEAVIFVFLGLSTVARFADRDHRFDVVFMVMAVVLCLVWRAVGVALQTLLINKNRIRKFNLVDQFIMAYGGLRGAVAYGLVVAIAKETVGDAVRENFIAACEIVILFTVFVQGATIKPLVNLLKVEKADHREKTLFEGVFERSIERLLAGCEDICGFRGHHWMRHTYDRFNTRYLRPLLLRDSHGSDDMKIVSSFHRLERREALENAADYRRMKSLENGNAQKAKMNENETNGGVVNEAYVTSTEGGSDRDHVRFEIPESENGRKESQELLADALRPIKYRRLSRSYVNDEESRHDLDEFRAVRRRASAIRQVRRQSERNNNRFRMPGRTTRSVYNIDSAIRGTSEETTDDVGMQSNGDTTSPPTQRPKPRSMSVFGALARKISGDSTGSRTSPVVPDRGSTATPKRLTGMSVRQQHFGLHPMTSIPEDDSPSPPQPPQSTSHSDPPSSTRTARSAAIKMPSVNESDLDDANVIEVAHDSETSEATAGSSSDRQQVKPKSSLFGYEDLSPTEQERRDAY